MPTPPAMPVTPHTNRLAQETSPYLLQHAHNPVDWWPWGAAAFAEARRRDVPVLLSVGYSTCHWCHVMAHESFEDEQTAAQMNAGFVNIKVDREERPDIDAVYMAATQALTGQGGWPMTVFLTPEAEPFYAGTYYPPHEGLGLPSFRRVLASISEVWQERREQAQENAAALTEHVREMSQPRRPDQSTAGALPPEALARAVGNLWQVYDDTRGGFGRAPKFPAPTTLDFLLTQPEGRDMALHTLSRMGQGGIYDQLGGGFHRYSVDAQWLVPHFEKMLYDNAQLARTLLRAYQATGSNGQAGQAEYARLARQTLDYLANEMLAPEGGFYSAQDADTPTPQGGVEGLTLTWTPQEIREALEGAGLSTETELALHHFGVTEAGNFTDPHHPEYGSRSVLFVPQATAALRREWGEDAPQRLEGIRAALLRARQQRPQPLTDTKRLTSWNGLALAAFADGYRVLREPHYLALARQTAEFIRRELRLPDGTLCHTFKDGQARVTGLLEDHALLGLGLVALYQAGGNLQDLYWARELWNIIRRDFWDEAAGVFYSSGGNAETLLTRQTQAFDSAVISDNAAAALLGLWMQRYFGDNAAAQLAQRVVDTFAAEMLAAAGGYGGLWQVAAFLAAPHTEVALIGTPAQRQPLEAELALHFLPYTALAPAETGEGLPVLEGRTGAGVAYVCKQHTCQLPTTDTGVLREHLASLRL